MNILSVLITESAAQAYRDLTSVQTTVLLRAANGQTSYDTASPREQAILDQLVDFGLLNDLSYEPTQKGSIVANMARKYGSRDARVMARRNEKAGVKPFKADGRYTDVGDAGDDIGAGDDVPSLSGGARGIERGEIYN